MDDPKVTNEGQQGEEGSDEEESNGQDSDGMSDSSSDSRARARKGKAKVLEPLQEDALPVDENGQVLITQNSPNSHQT